MRVKKFFKIFRKSENFSEIGVNLKQRGEMHHGLRGDGRPWIQETSDTIHPNYNRTQYNIEYNRTHHDKTIQHGRTKCKNQTSTKHYNIIEYSEMRKKISVRRRNLDEEELRFPS